MALNIAHRQRGAKMGFTQRTRLIDNAASTEASLVDTDTMLWREIGGTRRWGSGIVTRGLALREVRFPNGYPGSVIAAEILLPDESLLTVPSLYALLGDGYSITTLLAEALSDVPLAYRRSLAHHADCCFFPLRRLISQPTPTTSSAYTHQDVPPPSLLLDGTDCCIRSISSINRTGLPSLRIMYGSTPEPSQFGQTSWYWNNPSVVITYPVPPQTLQGMLVYSCAHTSLTQKAISNRAADTSTLGCMNHSPPGWPGTPYRRSAIPPVGQRTHS
jgi:hypothetical protein